MTSLLEIEDLSISFKTSDKEIKAVENISFNIKKGQITALVGESGSGKSVTALSILKLLPYPQAFHPYGSIKFNGKEILKLDDKNIREIRGNKISMIFQEPMTSLNPLHTIEKQISEVLLVHKGLSKKQAKEKCIELLSMVGLENLTARLEAYPYELSGGQRQRVMIAMALANEPDLLIADEPTTALDVTIQQQILHLIKELQKKSKMAVLLITHDLNIVRHMADHVCVMKNGKLVEQGKTTDIFNNPQDKYTKLLISSEPKGSAIATDKKSPIILQTDNLNVAFQIKKNFFGKPIKFLNAVNNASISLKKGETLGIVGESGSGKSTLAMAILRLLNSTGKITLNNQRIDLFTSEDMRPLRQKIQIVFQDPFASLNPRMNIFQIITEGLKAHKIGSKEEQLKIATEALADVGLSSDMLERYPHEFSGGQRQRIAIARAIALNPELIILDEPTSALDMTIQVQIINLLKELQKKYKMSYIFISHDLRTIKAISHNIIVMKNGDIVESGTTEKIFKSSDNEYTKKLIHCAFESVV